MAAILGGREQSQVREKRSGAEVTSTAHPSNYIESLWIL